MFSVTVQMAVLIACGVAWQAARPGGIDADAVRRVLTTFVYYLLLPALVLHVLWNAGLGADSFRIAAVAAACVLAGLALGWAVARTLRIGSAMAGAMILAAAFPNSTYMGLPVLEGLFGPLGRATAIQYDLFACTPLLLTVGAWTAQRFGGSGVAVHPVKALLHVPPLWAAFAGVMLNLAGVPAPDWLDGTLGRLGDGVVPLMLFSLGLALSWRSWNRAYLAALAPVLLIQLMLQPLLAVGLGAGLGLSGDLLTAVVLEAAMPSMVLGIVFCDRHGLDTGLYATAVTLTTAVSLLTLPLWFEWVSA